MNFFVCLSLWNWELLNNKLLSYYLKQIVHVLKELRKRKVYGNRPCSIYQYSNMAPRLSGQTSIFGVVFFVSKSLLGIERQKKLEKFAILTRKPRSHVRILIYRMWPIDWPSKWVIMKTCNMWAQNYRRKISSQRKGLFWPYLGVSNTPYLGTDVTFMYVSLPRVVWVLFQRTFQLVRLEALLEASKLTISFLKGLLVALCIFKLNCKQRLIKE